MSEFWKQFRARRENPCYTILGRRAVWRRALPLLLSLLVFSCISLIEMNKYFLVFILAFSPIVFWLLVPITFLMTMPRRLNLDELALTNLSRAEIAFGLLLKPYIACFILPIVYLLFVVAGAYAMRSDFSERQIPPLIGMGILVDLLAFVVVLYTAVRSFASHFQNPTKAFAASVFFGAVLLGVIALSLAQLAGAGFMLETALFDRPPSAMVALIVFIVGVWVAGRVQVSWTWSRFVNRLFPSKDSDDGPAPRWFQDESLAGSAQAWKAHFRLLKSMRRSRGILVTTVVLIVSPWFLAMLLDTLQIPPWGVPTSWLFFLGHDLIFLTIVILATTVYLYRMSTSTPGRLPVIGGGLLLGSGIYMVLPVCISVLTFILCGLTALLSGSLKDGEMWFFTLFVALIVQLIQVHTFMGWRPRRALWSWVLPAGLLIAALLLDVYQEDSWRFNPDDEHFSRSLWCLIAAGGLLFLAGGMQLLLQHIHDTRLRNVPRGELSEPLP